MLLNVAQVFFLAAAADEVLVSRQSNIEVSRATLENAKTRFAAGTVTKVDVDRAELALVRAEQIARDAEYARQQSYRALATLMQDDVAFKVVPPEVPLPTPVESFDAALNRRAEFRALILSEESADATRRAYALAVVAAALGVREGQHRELRRLHGRQVRLVRRRCSSTGRSSTAAPGTRNAIWRPRRRRRPRRNRRSWPTASATTFRTAASTSRPSARRWSRRCAP